MWLVRGALQRPVAVFVVILALGLAALLAWGRMPVDIFPDLGAPAIYVAQPYGGMDPAQMEGFLTYYYEYHFLYVTGIEHVESKNIQGASLMKLVFYPGTDMAQAMAQVVANVNRSRAFMPPGAVPPFVVRYDAGSVPVGQLVFSSANRSPGEMQDFALNRVRPLFATLPGVSAPPPFGGNQRTIVVRLDPQRMRSYRISPEEAIAAVNRASAVMPSGNVRTGDLTRIATTNATLGGNLSELMDAPVRPGAAPAVYLRDIGVIENGTDIVTGYAHVNGKRTVYIPVTKRADASTLAVLDRVKAALPAMRAAVPEDVEIRLEFDQSGYVVNAIRGLISEGLLGAALTGLAVLLFLRDWRSAAIVIATIPASLMAAVVWLWAAGQTINIMTLGGLALAVGVLVDEATVEIENIHAHLSRGLPVARAVVEACSKTATARLLSMASVLAVFVPSFLMVGVGRQLFVPLSLAVGFAMVSSYVLSSSLVPVLSVKLLRSGHGEAVKGRLQRWYGSYLGGVVKARWVVIPAYGLGAAALLLLLVPHIGTEIFPRTNARQYQVRLRAATGTRIERTEVMALRALESIQREAGSGNVRITTGFIGVQPPSYPVNTIYLWTSGPHEAVLRFALERAGGEGFEDRVRARLRSDLLGVTATFEAGDIVGQVMSFGSPTPLEIAVQGPNLTANREHAEKVRAELAKLQDLRDLAYAQPMDYPTLEVAVDRDRAGMYGLTMAAVAKSLVAGTSSSRFIDPNYWRDPTSGNAFQIQVEIPQHEVSSAEDVRELPVMANGEARPLLGDVAEVKAGTAVGQVDRYNMQRVVSLTANLAGKPLGQVIPEVREAIRRAGQPPRGVAVHLRGQVPPLEQTLEGLRLGLLLAVAAIFLLLAASFQSFRLGFVVLSTVPAVIAGVALTLALTGTTLNVQSFMGAIMAIGIAVANAILVVSFSERAGGNAVEGAQGRLRAVLMTASAMTLGMLPMALGLGESGEQTAPLGRAVIGGLVMGTFATLTVLPAVYAAATRRTPVSPSLDPDDPGSRFYEGG
ncbi:MAG: efflux RND transporter permease subunit [Bryobacteraceae bacterium]|nr:efflux RND transporter permease subunit [Bryobacteraceae bacterium]